MNENENNFESLRQLLAHKRTETPPSGYFNSFSGQIIARIRAGEGKAIQTDAERFFSEAPWLLKLLQAFELKPAFAGAFASALSMLLVFGIIYAERPDASAPQPILQASQQSVASFASAAPGISAPAASIVNESNSATSLQPVASMFGGSQNAFAQPVNFTPSGN